VAGPYGSSIKTGISMFSGWLLTASLVLSTTLAAQGGVFCPVGEPGLAATQHGEGPATSDSLRIRKGSRARAQLVFKSYRSYSINSDSLLLGSGVNRFAWVDSFRSHQQQQTSKPLLWSPRSLTKSMPESELSNLLADILRVQALQLWDTVDAAMLNPGGIRAGFPADTLRLFHVMEVLPFPNHLDRITLSGEELLELLHHWAGKGGVALSGIRMKIRQGKATDVTVGGIALRADGRYRLALPDYLVDGGDGCAFLRGTDLRRGAFRITDLVARHLEEMGKRGDELETQTDGRIRLQ